MTTATEWGAGFQARIILDSVTPVGCRLTTWVLRYPRFVHAELLTHRQFSRNSSSSRAIPVEKMIEQVEKEPALPVYWGKNQSGMQAKEELPQDEMLRAKQQWLDAREYAVVMAKEMHASGVHKQIVNRLLEPWMWITVVMSSTYHANWFALRDHPDAQPEIAHLARLMRVEYGLSSPTRRSAFGVDSWHLPFLRPEDPSDLKTQKAICVARCARVSYLTHEGVRSVEKDIELHDRLKVGKPPHVSPFEHVATAMNDTNRYGNFRGWRQYRHEILHESSPEPLYILEE